MHGRTLRLASLFSVVTALGLGSCTDASRVDDEGNTIEVGEGDVPATPDDEPTIPDGVIDDDIANENDDADGYCFDPESGYYPCDDGAPPGSGPPGTGTGDDDPTDPNDPGSGGNPGGGGQICTEDIYQGGTPMPPRILLVVDKSGSMEDPAVGYDGSKWQGARSALSAVLSSLDNQVELGLMLYPDGTANSNVCRAGELDVSVGPGRAADVIDVLNDTRPGGGTPTAATLEEARQVLDQLGPSGGPRVVVLATDGGPNCNASLDEDTCRCVNAGGCYNNPNNCLDADTALAAADDLNDAGYAVFVIGIPGSENFTDVLNSLADAGGTALAGTTRYYDANDSNALATALENIADRVSSCRFDLDGPVADPSAMTVRVGQTVLPRDPSRTFGWDLVDEDTLELFGAACTQASSSPVGVTVEYCFTPGG